MSLITLLSPTSPPHVTKKNWKCSLLSQLLHFPGLLSTQVSVAAKGVCSAQVSPLKTDLLAELREILDKCQWMGWFVPYEFMLLCSSFSFFSSFISISDLKSQQCMPCCSHLTWSTKEFKEWARQGKGALPTHSSLPRAYLILVGYLTDGRQEDKEKLVDGCLYVKDNTGIIPCEVCCLSEGFCVCLCFWGSVSDLHRLQMLCQCL